MIAYKPYFYLAQTGYSCDSYGAGNYSQCSTSSGTTPPGDGGLADTGYEILLPIFLAIALLIAGVILAVKKMRRNKAQANPSTRSAVPRAVSEEDVSRVSK